MTPLPNPEAKLNEQLTFTYSIYKYLLKDTDYESLIRNVIKSLHSLSEFEFVWVLLFDKDLNFESFLSEGLTDHVRQFKNSLIQNKYPLPVKQVLESGKMEVFSEPQKDCPLPVNFTTHSHVICPLTSEGNKYGLIGASIQDQSVWSDSGFSFFANLIGDVASAVLKLMHAQDLKQLIEDSQDGIVSLNSTLKILDVNQAFCKIIEVNREDIVGINGVVLANKLFSGSNLKTILTAAKYVLKGKSSKPFEVLYKNKVISVTTNFEKLAQNRVAIVKDITEIRKGELAAKENEEKLLNLVNALRDAVFIAQDGVIKLVNKTICQLSEFTEKELLGAEYYKFIAPEELQRVMEIHKNRLTGKTVPAVYESVACSKSGKRIPVEVSVIVVEFDLKPAWQVVLRDISEQKRIQSSIEKVNDDFKRAQQIGNMGSYRFDMNTFEVSASDQAYEIYGYSKDQKFDLQAIQKTPLPEYRDMLDNALKSLILGEAKYDVEFKIKNEKTGQILDIHSIAEYDQDTKLVSGVIQDITAKKKADTELKQTLKELYSAQKLADIGSWSMDLNTRQVFASDKTTTIYGFEQNEIISPEDVQAVHLPEYRNQLEDALNKLITGESGYDEQFGLKNKKTGEIFYIHSIAEYDKDKNLINGVLRDITKSKRAEQKLMEIATNFSNVFNVNQDTICILDQQGRITEMNQTFIDKMGYKRAELLGQFIGIIDKSVNEEIVQQIIADIHSEQNIHTIEQVHTTRSGHSFPVEIHSKLILYNGEERILSVSRDITERVKSFQALEEKEELFRTIFENKGTATAILDEQGYILLANQQCSNLSGYSKEELEGGMSWMSLVHPDDFKKLAEQQQLRKSNPDQALQAYEARMLNRKKETRHVLINIENTKNSQKVASLVDITERIQAAEKLKEQKNFLWLLVDNMPIQIYWKNTNMVYRGGNVAFADAVGLPSPKNVKGKTDSDFLRPADYNQENEKRDLEVMHSGAASYNHEEPFFRADGTQGIALTSRIPLLNEKDEVEGMLGFSLDITERKENESELVLSKTRAEESDRLKSAFLATVSHELRTPLNHILGFSDLIPELTNDKEIIEFANYINKSGASLLEIIEDIFNLAMVEQKQIKIRRNEVYIRDIFLDLKKQTQEALSEAGKTNNIKLDFHIEKSTVNKKIITDKPKIIQAVTTILKNAVKYTHQGEIKLNVELFNEDQLRISVTDTGIGIPHDKLDIIFDFFRQGDDSHTREYGGVGIGLALARKIADSMAGKIEVSSKVGEGSVFIFTLPVSTILNRIETELLIDTTTDLPDLTSKQILVVEDDFASMELISLFLKPLNCQIVKAWNGAEALDIIRINHDIDLVFMDLKMPVMDGFLSSIEIRKINSDVPIVALTAHALSSEKKRALESGCNDVITKPLKKNLIYELLKKILI